MLNIIVCCEKNVGNIYLADLNICENISEYFTYN